jgi:hypothetical protein
VKTDRAIITATRAGAVSTRHAVVAAQSKLKRRVNNMTTAEIKSMYDSNPDMTLAQLSRITGLSIKELKFILTCTDEEY